MSDLINSIVFSNIGSGKGKDFVSPTGEQFITAGPTREEIKARAPERGVMGAINDNVIEVANAAAGGVSSIANMVSPGNRVSRFIDQEIIKPGEAAQSDQVKAEKKFLQQDLAGAQGAGDEITAYLGYMARNPGLAISQVAGSFAVPGLAAKGANTGARTLGLGEKAASRFGLGTVSAVGGAMAGGDAAGSAYDLVKRTPKKILEQNSEYQELLQSMNPDQALEEIATRAARSASVVPAAIGATLGPLGAERILAGAGRPLTASRTKNALLTGGVDAGTEGFEEGVTQYSGQKAASQYNPTIDPMKGVAGAATAGAVMGAGPGLVIGALQTPAVPNPLQPVVDQAQKPGSVLSRAVVSTGVADQPAVAPVAPPIETTSEAAPAVDSAGQAAGQTLPQAAAPDIGNTTGLTGPGASSDVYAQQAAKLEGIIRSEDLVRSIRTSGAGLQGVMFDLQTMRDPNAREDIKEQARRRVEEEVTWAQTNYAPKPAMDTVAGTPGFEPTAQGRTPREPKREDVMGLEVVQATLRDPDIGPKVGPTDRQTVLQLTATAQNPGLPLATRQQAAEQAIEIVGRYRAGSNPDAATQTPALLEQPAPVAQEVASPEEQQTLATPTETLTQSAEPSTVPAVTRKRAATLRQLADQGFETVERRGSEFFLKNSKTSQEIQLEGMADAQLARNQIRLAVDEKANTAAASPLNDRAEPTPAQIAAGNYKKSDVIELNGMKIKIENPKSSIRRGTSPDGVQWETKMAHHYGEFQGTEGADGDKLDVFVGPRPDSSKVFVIDQVNEDGSFDEHKVMMGFTSEEAARAGYLANYEKGWTGLGAITEMPVAEFKAWAKSRAAKKPLGKLPTASAPASRPAVPTPTGQFATLEEAKGYLSQQRRANGNVSGLPLQMADGSFGVAIKGTPQYAEAERQRDERDAQAAKPQGEFFTVPDGGKQKKLKRIKKSAMPKKASPRRMGEPRELTQDEASMIEQVAAVLGKNVVFFEAQGDRIGDGFFLPNQPGVLYVATETTVNPLAVFGHEFFHGLRETNPEAWNAIAAVVRTRVADPKGFREDYYRGGDDSQLSEEKGGELEELVSDLGGNLMMDPTFWRDVFAKIREDHGKDAKGIIARLAAAIEDLIARVMKAMAQPGFRANDFVSDIESIRGAYKDGLADFIKAAGINKASMGAEVKREQQNIRKSMAGRGAKTADKYNLSMAEQMLTSGDDPEFVRQQTGWFKGLDKKWRFEISDDQAKGTEILENPAARRLFVGAMYDAQKKRIDAEKRKAKKNLDAARDEIDRILFELGLTYGDRDPVNAKLDAAYDKKDAALEVHRRLMSKHPDTRIRLADVLQHTQLYAAYPQLREVTVNFENSYREGEGAYTRDSNTIEISPKTSVKDNLSILLHEAQHAIQGIEGFARGGSPEEMISYAIEQSRDILEREYGDLPSYQKAKEQGTLSSWILSAVQTTDKGVSPLNAYRRLAGEVEARNVQRRQGLTDEERAVTAPSMTADVPDSDVIVIFNGEEAKNAPTPANAIGIRKSADRGLTVEAYHFSQQPRAVLNTDNFGTGLKGSARGQIMASADDRIKQRLSFYVDKGTGIKPEAGIGAFAHKATLTNIYDGDADPLRLRTGNARAFESKVLDAGFSGYLTRMEGDQSGQVVLLGAQTVQPELLGSGPIKGAKVVPEAVQRDEDVGDRLMANRALPAGQLKPDAWAHVLMATMPEDAAQLMDIGALKGDQALFKDELAALARKLGGQIRKSTDRTKSEYDAVVAKYKGTDAWMKAPDGAATKLGERQWVQVRTPAFKSWFGDWESAYAKGNLWSRDDVSKAVGANGEPLVVYHGTDKGGFTEFEAPGGTGRGDLGIWTTPDYGMASSYVRQGRPKGVDLSAPTQSELEDLGYEFNKEDGGVTVIDPKGYNIDGPSDNDFKFRSVDDAVATVIEEFAGEPGAQPGIYALFINVRNPNESNFEGAMWNGDRIDQFQVRDENDEPVYDKDGRGYFDRDTAEALVEANPGAEMQPADPNFETTDDVVRDALRNKNDSAIIREVIDDGGGPGYGMDPQDIFVAFDPTQVKSADYNNGEFSDSTGDLRKSRDRVTDTPAFKRWFGDSKVVDAEGKPLVVYHGTKDDIQKFDPEKSRINGGFFFSPSPEFAGSPAYTGYIAPPSKGGGNVMPVYLSIKNPKTIDSLAMNPMVEAAAIEQAKANGFDGIHVLKGDYWIAFSPTQIKSATGNQGTFDPANPDIRKSRGRKALEREDQFEMSTRIPTAKGKAVEDHMGSLLISDFAAGEKQEKWVSSVANLVTQYPNYRESERAKTPAQKLERLVRHMADNLVWLHNLVPVDTRQRSKLWYDGANRIARSMSRKYELTPAQSSGILAALSPQKDWFMNVSLGERVASIMAERQNFQWSKDMEATANRIYGAAKYQEDVDAIRGKTLADLDGDAYLQAMWVRTHDQAHNSSSFSIVSPEGEPLAIAKAKDGAPVGVAWGPNSMIAKSISIFNDGSSGNISEKLGGQHKVRNFFNNILVPNSRNGHVTIDTHAVAAALLRPLSGNSLEVAQNFGGASNAITGLQGTYALYEEAYRRAAESLGLLPRELQSITWEAIRGLYTPGFKKQSKNVDSIDKIWNQFKKGRLSYDGAKELALESAGGIEPPSWLGRDPGAYVEDESAAEPGDLSGDGVSRGGSEDAFIRAVVDDSGAPEAATRKTGDRGGRQEAGGPADRSPEASEQADADQGLSPLPDAPRVKGFTGPDPRLVAVAEKYASDNDITLRRQAEYVDVDPERATRIAEAYAAMPHAPNDPKVKAAYANLIKQTIAQYKALEAAGYKFWFMDMSREDNQEYASSPWNAMRDIRANKRMGVFPTADGFGSNDEVKLKNNPLEQATEFKWPKGGLDGPLETVYANDLFRAVHDAFGHGLEGSGFRARGEENAWQAHVRLFTGSAVGAITSETRGQNSWLNYGPYGEANRNAKVEDTVFADQKTGLMPEWTWTEGRAGDANEDVAPTYNQRIAALKDLITCLKK